MFIKLTSLNEEGKEEGPVFVNFDQIYFFCKADEDRMATLIQFDSTIKYLHVKESPHEILDRINRKNK